VCVLPKQKRCCLLQLLPLLIREGRRGLKEAADWGLRTAYRGLGGLFLTHAPKFSQN